MAIDHVFLLGEVKLLLPTICLMIFELIGWNLSLTDLTIFKELDGFIPSQVLRTE